MFPEDRDDHSELHIKAARYHTAVLLFHLEKVFDPFCDRSLPGLNPDVVVDAEMLDKIRENIGCLENSEKDCQ